MSRYAFGVARDLYASNVHPRVMLGPDDVVELRRRTGSGDGRKVLDAMRAKVRALADLVEGADDLVALMAGDGTHVSPAARIAHCVDDVAFVAVLDEDERALAVIRAVMRAVCGAEGKRTWIAPVGLATAYDMLHGCLDAAERALCVKAIRRDMARSMAATKGAHFKRAGGNVIVGWSTFPLLALLAIVGDPGAGDLSREQTDLLARLEASINVAINPDGYPEEDIGYGSDVAAWLVQVGEAARRAGLFDLYERCPHVARFGRAMLHFVQPWGTYLTNTGDFGGGSFGRREFALPRLATETGDPSLLWLLGTLSHDSNHVLTGGNAIEYASEVPLRPGVQVPANRRTLLVLEDMKGARHPSKLRIPTAYCDRRRGIVSLRSGWRADDTFVVFDGSHRSAAAQGHAHASCGNFSLSAQGEYFAIDCGRYNNEQNCHNVVLVDGRSGESTDGQWHGVTRPGLLTRFAPGRFVDFASADSSHQHNCYWAKRHLGLVKGRGAPAYVWVVDDINKSDDRAEYWWQLHTSPENTIRPYKRHATVTGWRCGNMLDVHFALPAADEFPDPHELREVTWDEATSSSYKYIANPRERAAEYVRPAAMLRYSAFVRPRLIARIAGWNGRFMSIMLPRAKGERKAVVKRLRSLPNSLAVRITFADVEDTVIFAFEHRMLETEGVSERGDWCVTRRSRKSGRVLHRQVGDI